MTTYTYKQLYDASPCADGLAWLKDCEARGLSLAQAWDECSRADWMFWALDKLGIQITPEQDLRLQLEMLNTPLSDGRIVLDLITDKRSLDFIEIKRRRLDGEEIDPEVWAAAQVAAGTAALAAAQVAARTAAAAAAWAAAGDAAGAAAGDAAWAAAWDAARDAAGDAARAAAWAWQADKLRETIKNPFAEE